MDEFIGYPKTPRLFRDIVVTEKLDGTNSQIVIGEDGSLRVGSRNRWITLNDDNYGFARWVYENKDELVQLGPGRHFGEWWGAGIQRNYGLKEKRFSLFNVSRWRDGALGPVTFTEGVEQPRLPLSPRPACCGVVPVLYEGPFDTRIVHSTLETLAVEGSAAVPGFMQPEGVVVFHTAANRAFKVLLEGDEIPKGAQ